MTIKRKTRKYGQLIVLEGADGVGKSTLAQILKQHFERNGHHIDLVGFPGNEPGSLGALVYGLHHNPQQYGVGKLDAASKQLLHIAAHLDSIATVIQPRLADGRSIILDRYWWSTWVYGRVAGVNSDLLEGMIDVERKAWGKVRPALIALVRRQAPIAREVNIIDWRFLQDQYTALAEREERTAPVLVLDDSPSPDAGCLAIDAALRLPAKRSQSIARQQIPLQLEQPANGHQSAPLVLAHLSPARPTEVYNTYWRFAAERQEIFFRRLEGKPHPWTTDHILETYKFTNAYRASDRVSQFLIKNVIYNPQYPDTPKEVFFRILLFKLFNKIETWQLLESQLGLLLFSDYSFESYDQILTNAMAASQRIYSAAYIMPSGRGLLGSGTKHRNHLRLLERMLADQVPMKIQDAKTMHQGFDILISYPMIGEFLAYQFITDINYSELTKFEESDFVVPGPGALDGIRKCFADLGGLNEPELIRFIADQQQREFERLELSFRSLWGRPLQLIDCQNLFCEVDKYSRVYHPEATGITGRTRIKQKFKANLKPIDYWYPPKWEINHKVSVPHQVNTNPAKEDA